MAPRCALAVVLPVLVPSVRAAGWNCPSDHKDKAATATCSGGEASTCSNVLCCDPTCAAHTCSDGWTANADKASDKCSGACDDAECCTKITKCADYTCLSSWQEKKENAPTDCDGALCATTCCENKEGTCFALMMGGDPCGADKDVDGEKYATEATAANYQDTCCKAKTCASFAASACPADEVVDATVAGAATSADYQSKCCVAMKCAHFAFQSCPTGKFVDVSVAEVATSANYQDTCCKDNPTCDSFTCSAAYQKKASSDLPASCTGGACSDSQCCTGKDICAFAGETCATSKYIKSMTAYASSDDFASTCCESKLLCSEAEVDLNAGTADGAPRMAVASASGAALAAALATAAGL